MVTTSFRDDEEVLEEASRLWESDKGPFSDKSDFYRFARDFALNEILDEYDPTYEDFEQRIEELDNIECADKIIEHASSDYFEAFDYAISIRNVLENDSLNPDEKIETALGITYEFIEDEFSGTYVEENL